MDKSRLKGRASPLVVALDVASREEALALCQALLPEIDQFKVGLELFLAEGRGVIDAIRGLGGRVFLDLKLHDIPNQVYEASRVLGGYSLDITTVHCLGGLEMLKAARAGVKEGSAAAGLPEPLILGVTILTSLEPDDLENMGVKAEVEVEVAMLAGMARDAGLDGVVASAREIQAVRRDLSTEFIIATPGIRPPGPRPADDQKRTLTPAEALKLGADLLIVGRPIIRAENPKAAALRLLR